MCKTTEIKLMQSNFNMIEFNKLCYLRGINLKTADVNEITLHKIILVEKRKQIDLLPTK